MDAYQMVGPAISDRERVMRGAMEGSSSAVERGGELGRRIGAPELYSTG